MHVKFSRLGHEKSYYVKNLTNSKHKYTKDNTNVIMEFLIENIFVEFVYFLSMGTYCSPLLANCFCTFMKPAENPIVL